MNVSVSDVFVPCTEANVLDVSNRICICPAVMTALLTRLSDANCDGAFVVVDPESSEAVA